MKRPPTKRKRRIKKQLGRLGSKKAGNGWARRQASKIRNRRVKHSSYSTKYG